MEYEWYADLFFLEEAYRDVLILWLAAVLGRKKMSVFRLLAAGIAGGLCGTAVSCLELSGNRSTDYGKKPGGLDFLGKRKSSDKRVFDYNGCASPKKSVRMEKSVLSKGKGAWVAGLVSGDPAERSCGP